MALPKITPMTFHSEGRHSHHSVIEAVEYLHDRSDTLGMYSTIIISSLVCFSVEHEDVYDEGHVSTHHGEGKCSDEGTEKVTLLI